MWYMWIVVGILIAYWATVNFKHGRFALYMGMNTIFGIAGATTGSAIFQVLNQKPQVFFEIVFMFIFSILLIAAAEVVRIIGKPEPSQA